jgi:hypothetical protein
MKSLKTSITLMVLLCATMIVFTDLSQAQKKIIFLNNKSTSYPGQGDMGWISLLQSKGYIVTRDTLTVGTRSAALRQGQIDTLNMADLIIIGRTTGSGNFADTAGFNQKVTKPLISLSPHICRSSDRLNWMTGANFDNGGSPVTKVWVKTHPIFTGVTIGTDSSVQMIDSTVGPYKSTSLFRLSVGQTAGNATVLAMQSDTTNRSVAIAYWPAGTAFSSSPGNTAGGKRMWFNAGTYDNNGGFQGGSMNLTAAGQKIFLNAVEYMLTGTVVNYALGPNLLTNGTFGSATGWTGPLTVSYPSYTANCTYDFNYSTTFPTGGTAPCLRVLQLAGNAVNTAYYQAVTLTSGIYALDGLIKNSTSTSKDYWVEFYLTSKLPTNNGPDVVVIADTTVELAWLKQSAWGGVDNYDGNLSALASSRKDTIKTAGTYYFVIKTGTLSGGTVDAVIDNLTLNKLIFTSVENEHAPVAKSFDLQQNYPNPFNPSTLISYKVSKEGFVSIKVYDLVGREVATLVNEVKQVGNYSTEWNAAGMCSGIYFYKMQTGSFSATRKMVLIK